MEKKGIEYYYNWIILFTHQIETKVRNFDSGIPELPGCKSHGLTVEQAVKKCWRCKESLDEDS